MASVTINGLSIAYDLLGGGERTVVITPGGRYSKDTPGIRPLAEAIAARGYRVLLWDRPNAGASDLCFAGASEASLCVETLAGLLSPLELGPLFLGGGSARAQQSLLMALPRPNQRGALFLFWVSGGAIGLSIASLFYCGESAITAARGGMAAVARLPMFRESLERNPANRDRLLALDPDAFIATMRRWAAAFFPPPGSPVPGYDAAALAELRMPILILRGDENDLHHPRTTTEELHALIPGSRLEEPVWGANEWFRRLAVREERAEPLFANCPALAPQILGFLDAVA